MSKDAILEIGTEEIPSSMLPGAEHQLRESAEKLLAESRVAAKKISVFSTPRRLALLLEGLPEKSADSSRQIVGPKASVWKDPQGRFTPQAEGFARSQGLKAEDLVVIHTPKGEHLCAAVKELGERTEKILAKIFPKLVSQISFPKSMVWESSRFRFARPIRNLLALYGNKPVSFIVAGIKSGRTSFGLGYPGKKIDIAAPNRYIGLLANHCILADREARRSALEKSLSHVVERLKGKARVVRDLLDEVTGLVEHPVAVLGAFGEEYLALPAEILESVLNKKQKFFAVEGPDGRLLPHFIGIRNGISLHQDVVREGFERVLAARLNDAAFFFKQDTATRLEAKVEKLKGVVFHASVTKAGESTSVFDKVERLQSFLEKTAGQLGLNSEMTQWLKRSALLSKADLVTDLVGEYPELQGVIGGLYAAHDKESPEVVTAVRDHYKPISQDDSISKALPAQLLALADKTDSLMVRLLDGYKPKGDADPFALRRAALGILRILRESSHWRERVLTLRQLLEWGDWSRVPSAVPDIDAKKDFVDFLKTRYRFVLEEEGFRIDEINAVLTEGWHARDLHDVEARLDALKRIRKLPDFEPLSVAYKRAANIVKQAREKNFRWDSEFSSQNAREDEERALYGELSSFKERSGQLLKAKQYEHALKEMVALRPMVDAFFEKVMVMVEDESLRANRLALMRMIQDTFSAIADFSALQETDSKNR